MTFTDSEVDYLAAWAREEWEPACYQLPAHRLQLAHGVSGASIILFIKAWTIIEKKKDHDILHASANSDPNWPWTSTDEFQTRLGQARNQQAEMVTRA